MIPRLLRDERVLAEQCPPHESPRVPGQAAPAKFGVAVPRGEVDGQPVRGARDREAARRAVRREGADPRRRPRQGRRRQARRRSPTRPTSSRGQILGMTLVTHQTGPEGRVVRKVLVEEALDIDRELYLGLTLDRATAQPVMMAIADGRHGDRGGRGEGPRSDRPRAARSRRSACFRSRRGKLAFALGLSRRRRFKKARRCSAGAVPRLHRDRRVAGRDQSARS